MTQEPEPRMQPGQAAQDTTAEAASGAQPWEEPKLMFIEPKLTKHGQLEEVTGQNNGGFFGPFTP
jgi:hypothetical protein